MATLLFEYPVKTANETAVTDLIVEIDIKHVYSRKKGLFESILNLYIFSKSTLLRLYFKQNSDHCALWLHFFLNSNC